MTSTPTIPTNFNQLNGTIPYTSISGTPFIPGAATFLSINPVNTWNTTSDGKDCIYHDNNESTVFKAPGDNPFIWRDDTNAEIMRLKKNVTLGIGLNPDFRLYIAAASGSAPTGAYKAFYGA